MKSLNNYINEWKFNYDKNVKRTNVYTYKYHPNDRYELEKILIKRLKKNIEEPYLLDIDTSKITDMEGLFSGSVTDYLYNNGIDVKQIKKLDLSSWLTHNVATMNYMFGSCEGLITLIHNFNTKNVIDMSFMFCRCLRLEELDLSGLNAPKLKKMDQMFTDCHKLKHVDLSNLKPDKLESVDQMFHTCIEIESIDLSNINTTHVKNMRWMFYRCEKLKQIIGIDDFDISNAYDMTYMFKQCYALKNNDSIPAWYDINKWESH